MPPIFLLTGFQPFRGERINPSWEVARRLDTEEIGGMRIKAVKVPVGCAKAVHRITAAVLRYRPRAILGLGEAGGRTAISIEKVAVNLADERGANNSNFGIDARPVIPGGPEAYFTRLPVGDILRALRKREIPVQVSLTAGAYACNALMYASLHLMRRRQNVPVGFVHLPYDARQGARHPEKPSMAVDTMEQAIRAAITLIARAA
ncbi:MAG: pyroglutamyl-peptidase I [Candidatus Binataceae bacterium]